jgi:transcriptional regulator with XRE-family HTH domain
MIDKPDSPADTVYGVQTELKQLMKEAECMQRDIAHLLGMRPSTLNNQLNGYTPMSITIKKRIEEIAKKRIKYLASVRQEEAKSINLSPRTLERAIPRRLSRSAVEVEEILRRFRG